MKTVAVLHTTSVTIEGLKPYFEELLPDVRIINFLDDSILAEINRIGQITPKLRFRFYSLMRQAAMANPDLLLTACSSVGALLEEGADLVDMPVVRIDEPMLREAIQRGVKIGVAATLKSTLEPTIELLMRCAKEAKKTITANPLLITKAGVLLSQGKQSEYLSLVADEIAGLLAENDIVILAQASMSGALKLFENWESLPVLTSPRSGIAALLKKL